MATVNYPELLPHPLVSDGYGFRSNQSQAVGLFDVETQSRDETRTVNVGFTFTDLQYKVFHGWFMNVLIHGQKWFNMRLDGEFYECTFGGVQPQYSLNRKIITVTATLKTRPSTGFVNYTNQRVSYPDAVNYMPSPFDPSGWSGQGETDGTIQSVVAQNPSGTPNVALVEMITGGQFNINNTNSAGKASIGDRFYISVMTKKAGSYETGIRFRVSDSIGFAGDTVLSGSTGERFSGGTLPTEITQLSDGYILIQIEFEVKRDVDDIYCQMIMWSNDNSGNAPIGAQLYMQAAFFGRTGKYQGAIFYNAVNYMPSPFDTDGWQGANDADVGYTKITTQNPSGETSIGQFEYLGPGTPPICQTMNNSILQGEKSYIAIIAKPITGTELGLRVAFQENVITYSNVRVNIQNGASNVSGGTSSVLVTDLKDDWKLIQIENTASETVTSDFDIYVQFYKIGENGSQIGFPTVGDTIQCQAAFFGKASDWPAIITPADPDQFPAAITYEY